MKTYLIKIKLVFLVLIAIGVVLTSLPTYAYSLLSLNRTNSDYYIVYTDNYNPGNGATLFLTSIHNTYGTVQIPGIGFSQSFTVLADTITSINIPLAAEVQGSDIIDHLGIRITSNNEITAYFLNPGQPVATNDAYVALPIEALGTDYIIMAWPETLSARGFSTDIGPSQLAIVSPYNNTKITITPSVTTGIRDAGVPYTITLDQFQTYTLLSDAALEDFTGTTVQSSAPIAVFSGNRCADIPAGYGWCDHIVQQMTPTSAWGKSFVTLPSASRYGGDYLRILASVDNTTLSLHSTALASLATRPKITGQTTGITHPEKPITDWAPNHFASTATIDDNAMITINLDRGEFYEALITGPTEILSNNPLLVAQFATGADFGGLPGDPFMMLIPPAEQFLSKYTFVTPTDYDTNFVNVIAPTDAINSLRLDGNPIDTSIFALIGSSSFSGASIALTEGSHTIIGSSPFAIYVYGFGSYVSYGYPGGLGSAPVNPPPPPSDRIPLIIVPGLGGTQLVNSEGELWIDIQRLVDDAIDGKGFPNNDYLDVLQLNSLGQGPLYPNDPLYATVQAGDVLTHKYQDIELPWYICVMVSSCIDGKMPLQLDFYNGLIQHFESQGYIYGQDLFLFGYDWRRDLAETSSQLDKLIDEYRGEGKVNLVAHSMGGLVSRQYILSETRASKVENLIILGTPFLGAPETFHALYQGDSFGINEEVHDKGLPSFMWVINENKIKDLSRNWPGIYQLLPSQRFFDLHPAGYIQEERDINGDEQAKGELNYDDTRSLLESLLNQHLVKQAELFHSSEFDGFDHGTNGVNVYLIVGVGFATKERIRFWEESVWWGLRRVQHAAWWYGNGDQTVLQHSADLSNGIFDYSGEAQVYYTNVGHGDLPLNKHVQQQISQLLTGNTNPVNQNISTTPDSWPVRGYWIEVNSPVELHIFDELGNHLGPNGEAGVIEYGIRNVQYNVLGHNKSAFMPSDLNYSIALKGTDTGTFDLRLRNVSEGIISTTVLFKDIPVKVSSEAILSTDPSEGYLMAIDEDGDGIFDIYVPPTAILDSENSLDEIAPATTISLAGDTDESGWFTGLVTVTMSAIDNIGGSGVSEIQYSTDGGNNVLIYTEPFVVDAGTVHVILSKAVDFAGNEEYPLAWVRLSPTLIFLPVILR